jgi:S-layer protein (TIGR01564 family)
MGAFTSGRNVPNYILDTDVRDADLKGNLILIGGPTVNMVTRRINNILPVSIDLRGSAKIRSSLSGKTYKDDEIGMIVIVDNPFDRKRGSKILVIAGNRFQGTRSAVISWIKDLDNIMAGNLKDRKVVAKVVRGYDMDGDGVIDSSEVLE